MISAQSEFPVLDEMIANAPDAPEEVAAAAPAGLDIIREFNGASIRILGTPDAPLFVAKDVCECLGISNSRDAMATLDADEKGVGITDTLGGKQQVSVVTESGLYALAFKSRKDDAKAFRKWVTGEVLPAIRKTGSYGNFAIPATRAEALRLAADLEEKNQALTAKLEEAAPKVDFYDAVAESGDTCQVAIAADLAKLPFGRNTLFMKLRQMGVLISGGERHNLPYREYVERGYFTVRESKFIEPETKETRVSFTPCVTQKGIAWLIRTFGTRKPSHP